MAVPTSDVNVLVRLRRIFECLETKQDACSELRLLQDHCESIIQNERQQVKTEIEATVRICEFAKLHFPKGLLNRCPRYIPVRYDTCMLLTV